MTMTGSFAQDNEQPFLIAETMPSFRGGDLNTFRAWVQENVKYPAEAVKNKKIDMYFQQTFTEMFGGGKGALVLEDPENPLTCGIEIRVQPPGKQPKTITLLSGGEKAFVAIALYFSIMNPGL